MFIDQVQQLRNAPASLKLAMQRSEQGPPSPSSPQQKLGRLSFAGSCAGVASRLGFQVLFEPGGATRG